MYRRLHDLAFAASPDAFKTGPDIEKQRDLRSENGPEIPPPKEPGDAYVLVAAIVGLVLGAALGFFTAFPVVGVFIGVLCTIGGALVGSAAGTLIGESIKKSIAKRREESRRD